ncbi:rhomboid family intramembrane serine protease [Streptomyces sp. NPDC017529]|uniref:rhomboid family intramembrane serine protease n=1 Tax=Streptomyces sp. NPDC017529 TaxID=3365000 RepID=UPI0037B09C56
MRTRATTRARPAAALMLGWIALLWVLEAADAVSGNALDTFGVRPRELGELADVLPAAFVHFGFDHLAANTLPLLFLGFLAALRSGLRRFVGVALLIALTSGLGVWLTAPAGSNTAGASGVVFGLFGYLLVRGFIDRKPLDIGLGVLVAAVYGSILWGALPTGNGISWQGHLFGLAGGVLAAFAFRQRPAASLPGGRARPIP